MLKLHYHPFSTFARRVRIALIENEARTRQAVRGIKEMFRKDGLL